MRKVFLIGSVLPHMGGVAYGGVTSFVQDLVTSPLSEEYAFEIFARPMPRPPGAEGFFGRNLFRLRRFALYLRRLWSEDFYLVHIHLSPAIFFQTTLFLLPAVVFCKRVIIHIHGMNWPDFYENRSWLIRFIKIRILSLAARVVVLYPLLADNLVRAGLQTEVRILPNRLPDISRPDPVAVADARKQFGLTGDIFAVLVIGDISRPKGLFDLLEAVPSMAAQDDSVRILVAGQEKRPGDMASAGRIIQSRQIGKYIKLLGQVPRDRIPVLLAMADAFLLPSHTESMPISILEAMRAGVPVIASRVGGIPATVEDGVTGVLMNPGRPEEITQAILKLKRDPDLCRKMGIAARLAFEQRFEQSRGMDQLRSLYQFD